MITKIKQTSCLERLNAIIYHANPSLESSGRYIKSLRQKQRVIKDENEKTKYEYIINRLLQKHLYFLQASIVHSYGKQPDFKISNESANSLINVINSSYAVSDGKYTFVDVDTLKQLDTLEKSVLLRDDIVLPINVKSENYNYKFKTQIVLSKENVLTYATYGMEEDTSSRIHNVVLLKKGSGIAKNELLENAVQRR